MKHSSELSSILTVAGVATLFALSIGIVLVAPSLTEDSWTQPLSSYQKQMYEVADKNIYLSTLSSDPSRPSSVHTIYHLHGESAPLAFIESETVKIVAPPALDHYVTRRGEPLKLTRRILLLREPRDGEHFLASRAAETLQEEHLTQFKEINPDAIDRGIAPTRLDVYELYDPELDTTLSTCDSDGITESWAENYINIEGGEVTPTLFLKNPRPYIVEMMHLPSGHRAWQIASSRSATSRIVSSPEELAELRMGFMSRAQLISMGENIYAAEGCYTCHTDQTRTLIQDVVASGLDHPAPPSSPGEYVYQRVTYPGTKRNGPDLSRVGVKRMSRDWHMAHFWSPKTASPGSIMPSFRHFFDFDPKGTAPNTTGIPNVQFEAIYQYLMTKGTRLTSPSKAWWRGRDPRTQRIIEGSYTLRRASDETRSQRVIKGSVKEEGSSSHSPSELPKGKV